MSKQRIMVVSASAFTAIMNRGVPIEFCDVPADMEAVRISYDPWTNALLICVASDEFEDVPDGKRLPQWQPTIRDHKCEQ